MKTKRIFGYIFLLLAIILTLLVIRILPDLMYEIINLFLSLIEGAIDIYNIGFILAKIVYYVVYFIMLALLWIYGIKWIKKPRTLNLNE